MKYMIMTFGDASSLATRSREWVEEMISFMKRIDVELAQSGELVFQQGLTDPATAKTVTVDNGEPVVTDGPLSNPMEALQGFWVVDVENEGRAVDIAAQISEAADTRIEVRECADAPPDDAAATRV